MDLALDLAVQENNHREIGVLLRLQGLYHMMTGNYEQAEKRLLESINALTVTESMARSYTVNIAASYNYIGEILMEKEDYVQALPMFPRRSPCAPAMCFPASQFSTSTRERPPFFQRDYAAAQAFLEKALALYGQFDSFWRRPTLNSYLALTLVENRNLPAARRHLLAAQKYMWQMKNPSDQGSVIFLPSPDPHFGGPGTRCGTDFLTRSCRIPRWTMDAWPSSTSAAGWTARRSTACGGCFQSSDPLLRDRPSPIREGAISAYVCRPIGQRDSRTF